MIRFRDSSSLSHQVCGIGPVYRKTNLIDRDLEPLLFKVIIFQRVFKPFFRMLPGLSIRIGKEDNQLMVIQ